MESTNIESGNRLPAEEVIGLMTRTERLQACRDFWTHAAKSPLCEKVADTLETMYKIGKGRLFKKNLYERAEILVRDLHIPTQRFCAEKVLYFWALKKETPPSISTMFSVTPKMDEQKAENSLPTTVLVESVQSLLKDYPEREVLLLLACLAACDKMIWRELPTALDQLGVNLRKSLADTRSQETDPLIASLHAEMQSLKSQLTTEKEALSKSDHTIEQEREKHQLEVAKFRHEISALEADREAAIEKGIASEMSAVVRPWLEEARRLQGLSADRMDKSLVERAVTLLHAQEALDMKYGSRTRLRRRLKEFEDYASKIRSVLEDSVRPSEDFGSLLAEIESEIQRTRVVLGEDRTQSQLVIKLEEAIHKAASSEFLDSLADNIAALHNAGVFTHKEHLRLTKQKLKAYDRLRTRDELKPAVQQRRSGWELCQVVGSNKKAVVYLDGNNVVHRDDRYAHLFDESGKVSQEVENALRRDVLALASQCPAVTFRVVFDSHASGEETLTQNVIVHRSGGSGTDRADSAIVLHLTATPDGGSRFVITDDISLRQQTTSIGGVYADVVVWDVLLESFGV